MNASFRYLISFTLLALLIACEQTPTPPRELSSDAIVANNRGVGLMRKFDYEQAQQLFRDLVEQYPQHLDLRINLAVATFNQQREDDEAAAQELLDSVLEQQPNHLRAHYCKGILALHGGIADEAAEYFRVVAAADPADAYAIYYLAQSLAQQGDYQQALEWYQRALTLDEHLRSAYYGAFQAFRQLNQLDQAKQMLELYQRLEVNPQARLVEFKYTRMGPRCEALTLDDGASEPAPQAQGELFTAVEPLPVSPNAPAWQELVEAEQSTAQLSSADIDGDGRLDLFVANAVLLQQSDGRFEWREDHPLAGIERINAALWGDIDNDGLIDAYFCRQGPNQLWRQTEANQWQEIGAQSGTANGDLNCADAALFDADHDGDLDIFIANNDGPNALLSNNLDGTFRLLADEHGLNTQANASRRIVTVDLDSDRDVDLIVLNQQSPHEIYINDRMWQYRVAEDLSMIADQALQSLVAGDQDADGYTELYGLSPQGELLRWSFDGENWQLTVLAKDAVASQLALQDSDGDGLSELIYTTKSGWQVSKITADGLQTLYQAQTSLNHWLPVILDNNGPALLGFEPSSGPVIAWPGPGRYPFTTLSFSGLQDQAQALRSNSSAIGTRFAARRGSRWTVGNTLRSDGGPGQSLQPIALGTGSAKQLDFILIDWSDGVSQSELDLAAGQQHRLSEVQRQLASCPVLFGWNGRQFEFVSDLLGASALGFAVGFEQYSQPRGQEYFQFPSGFLKPHAGAYQLKLTEPMEETSYIDAVALVAYDLPPGWQLVLDERLSSDGSIPSGEAKFYRHELLPAQVVNQNNEDVTRWITQNDFKAAPVTALDQRFVGLLQQPQELIIEFAQALDSIPGDALLVIDGWIEFPYSQTLFAAWQSSAEYQPPVLDVWYDGEWQTFMPAIGYPAGMPKRMSVPLADLPAGVTRLRLRTNLQIYWDRIAVAYAEKMPANATRQELPLRLARLEEIGYPQRTSGLHEAPYYDYDERKPLWDTKYMAGFYTEYGPVEELVNRSDAALALIGSGESLHLEFALAEVAKPLYWNRYLILQVDGWVKDMDLYTKTGATLAPLPGDPGDTSTERDALHERYHTRYRSGR